MREYTIIISEKAKADIEDFYHHIKSVYKQPLTAVRNRIGLYKEIMWLSRHADAIGANEYIQTRFGFDARHITFKKMTIIYLVDGNFVYIRRVVPSSLIY